MKVSLLKWFFRFSLIAVSFAFLGFVLGLIAESKLKTNELPTVTPEKDNALSASWRFDPTDPLLAQRKIYLTGEITQATTQQIVTAFICLDAIDSKKPIDLLINSMGGYSPDAKAIVDAMHLITAPVNTWAIGTCRSAAAEVLAGGTGRRYITPHTSICFHRYPVPKDAAENSREYIERNITREFWLKVAKLPDPFLSADTEVSEYFTPAQAVKYGMADEVRLVK